MQLKKGLLYAVLVALVYVGAFSTAIASDPSVTSLAPQQPLAQACGVITNPAQLRYPVDRTAFFLINPFSRPSARFDGRLHTGDDWVRIQGESLGEPVYAIGPGRVTYSNPLGWGRDKGVIIIEHIMSGGFTVYALYGHLEERDDITFPPSGTCVNTGDVLGVIGDPRPAPHLHFEIRIFDPFEPGPGYWPIDPQLEGWLNPSQFIDNWTGWLNPAHIWHVGAGDADGVNPPPLMRDDGTLVYVDGSYLNYLGPDGRLIRQYRMADSVEPVGLVKMSGGELMATRDGRLLSWSLSEGLIGQVATDAVIEQGPYVLGEMVWLQTETDELLVFSRPQQTVIASYTDIGEIRRVVSNNLVLALLDQTGNAMIFDSQGRLIKQLGLNRNSDLLALPTSLVIRDDGTLYRWDTDGTSETLLNGYSVNRTDSQLALVGDQILMWGIGGPTRLSAIDLRGVPQWETDLADISGPDVTRIALQPLDRCTTAMLSPQGVLLLFDHRNGRIVGNLTLWGQNRTNVWIAPTIGDGFVRLQVADQIAAYALDQLSVIASDYCR